MPRNRGEVTTMTGALDVRGVGALMTVEYGVPLAEVDTPRVDKRGAVRVEGCS